MDSKTLHCKGCGARLTPVAGETFVTCEYCGTVNEIERPASPVTPAAPQKVKTEITPPYESYKNENTEQQTFTQNSTAQKKTANGKGAKFYVRWFFGVMCILAGIDAFADPQFTVSTGIICIIVGILLIPSIWTALKKVTVKKNTEKDETKEEK